MDVFVSEQVTEWGPYTYKVIRQREEISDEDEGKERIRFAMRGTYRYIPGLGQGCSILRNIEKKTHYLMFLLR